MTSLILTYVVAWGGIGAFAVQLIMKDRRLIRRVEELSPYGDSEPQYVTHMKTSA